MKEWKSGRIERESIACLIPERNRGDTRSKEVAVAESKWVETGNWETYMCCPRTSIQNKCNKKWHWSLGRVPFMQALQRESWKCYRYCQFVLCPSWKPIQEETRQTYKNVHWLLCNKSEIECETNGWQMRQMWDKSQCWKWQM